MEAVAPKAIDTAYRRDLDGLRAIAILLVVLFHYEAPSFSAGYVGVDIFFVISGFLITDILFRSAQAGRFRYRDFYIRRACRLLPALFCVVIFTTLVAYVISTPYELKIYAITAIATLTGVSNVVFVVFTDYFSPKAVRQLLLMGWSLSVELQFYLVLPPLILIGVRRGGHWLRAAMLAAVVLSFGLAALIQLYRPAAAYYLMPFRFWEIGVGGLIALRSAHPSPSFAHQLTRQHRMVAATVLLALALFLPEGQPVLLRQVMAVAAAAMIVMPGVSGAAPGILGAPPLVGLGRISYSWYLWHWPPVAALHMLGIDASPVVRAALMIGTLIVAVASYYAIELPFQHRRTGGGISVRRYAPLWGGGVAALFLLVISGGVTRWASLPVRQLDADVRGALDNNCLVAYGASSPRSTKACLPSGRGSAVALVGDSHANAMAAGIAGLAADHSLALYQMTKSACQPILGYDHFLVNHPTHAAECAAFLTKALLIIRTQPRIRVVILAGYWSSMLETPPVGAMGSGSSDGVSVAERRMTLASGLDRMITALRRMGRTVIVMQDVPRFSVNPYSAALNDLMPVRTALADRFATWPNRTRQDRLPWSAVVSDPARPAVADVAAGRSGVLLFDPVPSLCDRLGCKFRAGQRHVFYADTHHLSKAGAIYTARRFAEVQAAFDIPSPRGATELALRTRRVPSEIAMQ
jgi:peptidoglycan/LPS O-acetylase OafA/YrhL